MKLFLLLIIVVLIGVLFFYDFSPKKMIQCVQQPPIWFGPAGKLPPNPPVRWGYRHMCKKRLNC